MRTPSPIHRHIIRSIVAAWVWLTVLYVIDIIDGIFLIGDSTGRVSGDAATEQLIVDSVAVYIAQMYTGYMVLAMFAVFIVHFAQKLWFPVAPNHRRFWRFHVTFAACVSAWGTFRQILVKPTIHDWMGVETLQMLHDGVPLWGVDLGGALMAAVSLWVAYRRWDKFIKSLWMKSVLSLGLGLMITYGLLSNPSPKSAQANQGPNVIIIGVDALRPAHLSLNGYERSVSPNIDAFMSESAVFSQAFTPIARTYPSWTSILTGMWPSSHGIRDNLPTADRLIPPQQTLAQTLQGLGYHSHFVTDDSRFSYMVPEVGFDAIFQPEVNIQNFAISMTEPRFRAFHSWMHNPIGFALVPTIRHNQAFGKSYDPSLFADAAVDQLAEASLQDQFFYALHSCVLHAPGDRNYPYSMKFGMQGYEGPNRFRYSRSGTAMLKESIDENTSAEQLAEQDLRIYDSGLSMADELVGKLMKELKSSGLWDNSLVILVSDHGENMWSEDLPYRYKGPNHGFHPYGEGQHHVALAIHFPDGQYAGEVVDSPVRLIDISPTISDYLELDWNGPFDGRSVMPLLNGKQEVEPRLVYIETGLSEPKYWQKKHKRYPFKRISDRYAIDFQTGRVHIKEKFLPYLIAAKDRSLQVGRWKLVWRPLKDGADVELYDRIADPENRNNIYHEHKVIAAKLGLRLKPFLLKDGVDMVLFDVWSRIDLESDEPDWWD